MSNMNPLSKYTKIESIYTKLVSNNTLKYKDSVLKNSNIECGVCARSARDEILFNNPDALLNGEAVANVIENCVPNVLNARELYLPDVEQLLIAIKLATKEKTYYIETDCPECKHHGAFERDLESLLYSAQPITELPHIILEDAGGLIIRFKPYTWGEFTDLSSKIFMEEKKAQHYDSMISTEEEQLSHISEVFNSMAQIKFDMIVETISSVETPDGDIVEDKAFIKDWLGSVSSSTLKEITTKSDELMNLGVDHTLNAECSECHHEWEITGLVFDPSSFFGQDFSSQNQKK